MSSTDTLALGIEKVANVNHLLFADDSLLFCRANVTECLQITEILSSYECVSGQKVNLQKSEVCFSRNIKRPLRSSLAALLGVLGVDHHATYLGMPTFVGRNKSRCFAYIKERLWKRLQSWKGKCLSAAGKEILIKSVALAIPLYTMNCYLLPKHYCEDLNRLIASFWWNDIEGGKRIHWLSWTKLCTPKVDGGLGIRNLYAFNLSLLAKQGWRILVNPNSLVSRILKAKYFPNVPFPIPPTPGFDGSWIREKCYGGYGLIMQDTSGCFVAAKCGGFADLFSPLQSEAMAVRVGLIWALERGFSNILCESDSLQIVEALRDPSVNLSHLGQLIEDIKSLAPAVIEAPITHVRCQADSAAHILARLGLSMEQCDEWMGSPPSIITDILVADTSPIV